MVFCPKCGFNLGEPPPLACRNCGMIFAPKKPSEAELAEGPPVSSGRIPAPQRICPVCPVPLTPEGELSFRVGGSVGASAMFKGTWNELSEQLQPFSVYHCPSCGKIELYEPGS
jgi:rubredoxin